MMDMEKRKTQYRVMFRDIYNWLLATCEIEDKNREFFIATANEMVKLSGDGYDPLRNALLMAVYGEMDRLAREAKMP